MVEFWEYIRAVFRNSFLSWEKGERVANLIIFLVTALVGLLSALGIKAAIDITPAGQIAIGASVWFFTLVLLVTPFRIWQEQRERLAKLDQVKRNGKLLDDISSLRKNVAELRIAMQQDVNGTIKSVEEWEKDFKKLESKITAKIKRFASPAEARIYNIRGNIIRNFGPSFPPHQRFIDICIHDLDHLKDFVIRHSPTADKD